MDTDPQVVRTPLKPSSGASSARWWLVSLVFHSVLLGWLIFFSPVRFFNPAAKPKVNLSPTQSKHVIQDIKKRVLPAMKADLKSLEGIRGQMVVLENHKLDEFKNHASVMGNGAPEKALQLLPAIAQLQAAALATLDQAGQNCNLAVHDRANAYHDDLEKSHKLATDTQTHVLQLQDQAQELLSFGDARYAPALAAQTAASDAQDRAAKALVDAASAIGPSRNSRRFTPREGEINHYTYWLRIDQDLVSNAATNLSKASNDVSLAVQVLDWAKKNAASTLTNTAAGNSAEARAAADKARRMVNDAQWDLDHAQKRLENFPQDVEKARRDIPEMVAKVKQWQDTPEPKPMALTPEDENLVALEASARQLQAAAQQAQAAVAQAMANLPPAGTNTAIAGNPLAVLDKIAPNEPAPSLKNLDGMNMAQVYDSAVKTESSLVQSYRRLRAAHLAIIQNLTLSKAVYLTDVAKPEHPDLVAKLEQASINSGDQAVAVREAVQTAQAQISGMVELATSMLTEARSLDNTNGVTPLTPEQYTQASELQQKIEKLASSSDYAVDETGNGNNSQNNSNNGSSDNQGNPGDSNNSGSSGSSSNSGNSGNPSGNPGGNPGKSGTGNQANGGNSPDMGQSGTEGPFGKTGFGGGPPVPGAGRSFAGQPQDVSDLIHPAPGRRIAAQGASSRWLAVDSWYVLGPFDNTDRRNIERKFAPETIIDLNATYPGKHGIPIRWEVQQSGSSNVRPEFRAYTAAIWNPALTPHDNNMNSVQYVIYYAYTELWFEQDCDLWVAFGSDDFGKVWVNGGPYVWASDEKLKAWQLNENIRKLHFKKGINRVLYRVENGNNITEFSMVLSVAPGTPAVGSAVHAP